MAMLSLEKNGTTEDTVTLPHLEIPSCTQLVSLLSYHMVFLETQGMLASDTQTTPCCLESCRRSYRGQADMP